MKTIEQLYAFILTSSVRKKVLEVLYKNSPLQQMSVVKKVRQKQPNISIILLDLEKEKLIECLTPNKKAWKVYSITELGREVIGYMNKC